MPDIRNSDTIPPSMPRVASAERLAEAFYQARADGLPIDWGLDPFSHPGQRYHTIRTIPVDGVVGTTRHPEPIGARIDITKFIPAVEHDHLQDALVMHLLNPIDGTKSRVYIDMNAFSLETAALHIRQSFSSIRTNAYARLEQFLRVCTNIKGLPTSPDRNTLQLSVEEGKNLFIHLQGQFAQFKRYLSRLEFSLLEDYWVHEHVINVLTGVQKSHAESMLNLGTIRVVLGSFAGVPLSRNSKSRSNPQFNRTSTSSELGAQITQLRTMQPFIDLRIVDTPKVAIPKAKVGLMTAYPDLKRDVRAVTNGFARLGRDVLEDDSDYIKDAWAVFNKLKNNLILLGYGEYRATKFICAATKYKQLGFCEFTKQWLPHYFLVDVVVQDKRSPIKMNWIVLHTLNHSASRPRFVYDSSTRGFNEATLSDENYGITNIFRSHTFNVLSWLSARALPSENTLAFSKQTAISHHPFMGVELEVERKSGIKPKIDPDEPSVPICPERIHDKVYELLGRDFVILKHDGSLSGYKPFEIVTVPATLAYHQEAWSNFLDDREYRTTLSSYASGRCGMHVHINRRSFTGLHLAKFMRFINAKVNYRFVCTIAQRTNNGYAEYKDESLTEHTKRYCNDYHDPRRENRRVAVNCINKATIEVRIFRGNLSKVGFFKNLEFVHALWLFTKDASMAELDYKTFLRWLFDPKNDTSAYKHLKVWLVGSKYNVSNIIINNDTPEQEKLKLLEQRKKVKQIQNVIRRKYALSTDIPSATTTLKFGKLKTVSTTELIASQ